MTVAGRQWRENHWRHHAIRILTALVITIAVPAGWPAEAAAATTCTVRLDGLPATLTTDTSREFDLALAGSTSAASTPLKVRYHLALPGLVPEQVRVERHETSGAWTALTDKTAADGDVKAIDTTLSLPTGGSLTVRYRLTLLSGAPTGQTNVKAVVLSLADGSTVIGRSSTYPITAVSPAPPASSGAGGPAKPNPGQPGGQPAATASNTGATAGDANAATAASPAQPPQSLLGSHTPVAKDGAMSAATRPRLRGLAVAGVAMVMLVALMWWAWRRLYRIHR